MRSKIYLFFLSLIIAAAVQPLAFSQSSPLLYFCERYDSQSGEVGISDRFTTGYLTVMVRSDEPLGLSEVTIQFDKWNAGTRNFEFYKSFDFVIEPEMDYIFFSRNDESDMSFDQPGFYRVFLLNEYDETVTSSLVQVIE